MAPQKDWSKIADEASAQTQSEFANKISSLTSLTDSDLIAMLNDSSIKQEDLAKILGIVHDATLSNDKKAEAISNINGGLTVIVNLAKKALSIKL
jgi:hypothetical protein